MPVLRDKNGLTSATAVSKESFNQPRTMYVPNNEWVVLLIFHCNMSDFQHRTRTVSCKPTQCLASSGERQMAFTIGH